MPWVTETYRIDHGQAPKSKGGSDVTIAQYAVRLATAAVLYAVAGRIGLAIPFTANNVSPIWPASGVALACLLLFGWQCWPAIAVAAFLVNFFSPLPALAALGLAVGNTSAALAGAFLLRRIPGFRIPLSRLRDVLALIAFPAALASTISASFGSCVFALLGIKPWASLGPTWLIYYLGDATGLLAAAPLLLSLGEWARLRPTRRILEFLGLLLLVAATCLLLFDERLHLAARHTVLALLVFPFVLWAAIRFGISGTAMCNIVIASVVAIETAGGFGPFSKSGPFTNALLLQFFSVTLAVSGLLLAAVIAEQHNAEAERGRLIREQAAQEASRESEKRYRLIVEMANEGIWTLDSRRHTTFVNHQFAQMLGYEPEEMLGKNASEFCPDDFPCPSRTRHAGECRLRRKDSRDLWGVLSATPIPDEQLGGDGMLVMVTDITERKRAEEAVREREERHRTILQTAMDGFWETDTQGRLLEVNESYCRMSGYNAEELLAKRISDLEAKETASETADHLRRVMVQGEDRFESRHRRKDGSILDVEISVQYKPAEDGRLVVFLRDVSERKRAEEERNRLQLELAQAQKIESVGRLAGGIAHDFGNLMSVIILHADSALEEQRSGDPVTESVRAVQDAARRAVALTRQLMAFSRQQVLETEVLNLNSVIAECEKMLRRLIGEDIDLVFIPGPGLGQVKADPGQLSRIIMNLALNSRDAMPQGGKLIIETACVELDEADTRLNPEAKPGSYVMLAVGDTGTGMDDETQARAFEPFFTTKEVGKGTGLGLSMVYGIVKQSNGYVTVHSEPGHGTEFRIYLPSVLEAPEPVLSAEAAPMQRGVETILVAEDEPVLREKVCGILEGVGYQVLVGNDVGEVIQIATQHKGPLDLLLTDVVMPDMSGPQLAQHLQPLHPRMKVLYMSGYPDPRKLNSGLASDVDLIPKPFTKQKLLRRLREVLEPRKLAS